MFCRDGRLVISEFFLCIKLLYFDSFRLGEIDLELTVIFNGCSHTFSGIWKDSVKFLTLLTVSKLFIVGFSNVLN